MNIIFAGTPDFAASHLHALIQNGEHNIVAVYTQPDRPSGRGQKLTQSPVKKLALEHNIEVFQPLNLKSDETIREIASHNADIMIVVAYGLLLPQSVLDAPKHGCINIHASILPRWRGSAPIHRAIEAGDAESGVCIMQMEKGLDTGPVHFMSSTEIGSNETSGELHDRLANMGAKLLVDKLNDIPQSTPLKQEEQNTTYANKLDKKETIIDWHQSAEAIHNKIRAFQPWPIATTSHHGTKLRIWSSTLINSTCNLKNTTPGKISEINKHQIIIETAAGKIAIDKIQKPGGKPIDISSFLNGYNLTTNDIFE